MKQTYNSSQTLLDSNIQLCNGTILVLTIGIYNQFGYNTDCTNGKGSIYDFISTVKPDFEALLHDRPSDYPSLFCLAGSPPCLSDIFEQYERMLKECNERYIEVKNRLGKDIKLSFRMIAHYGSAVEYKIGNTSMLFGEGIAEAQQLSNNSIFSSSYLLISNQLLDSIETIHKSEIPDGIAAGQICEVYGDSIPICFLYYDYSK